MPNSTVEFLTKCPEANFRDIVDQDLRGQPGKEAKEIAEALRSPEVVRRWHSTLLSIQKNVEAQLASKAAETRSELLMLNLDGKAKDAKQTEANFERWRAGALRFKSGVEQAIFQARDVIDREFPEANHDRIVSERNEALTQVMILKNAIRKHRDSFTDEDDASKDDHELWEYVKD